MGDAGASWLGRLVLSPGRDPALVNKVMEEDASCQLIAFTHVYTSTSRLPAIQKRVHIPLPSHICTHTTPPKVFMSSLWPDQGKELQVTFIVVDDSSVWLLLIPWDKTWIQKTGALMTLTLCRPQLI